LFLNEKSPWGLSAYNEQNASDKKDYDLIYEGIKQILKKIGLKKMYFVPFESERALTPQKMIRKDLIKTGFELVLWHREKDIVICLTEQVLDIDALSDRDKNRPFTRPLLLLGLALARTMVNLVNIEKNNQSVTIYDPFCGMGSIVQEAYLLGYQSLGSDIDPSCVERSIKNLQWIGKNFELKEYPEENIFEMDINNPIKEKFENKEIAIVSEPDLLTPLKDYPPMSQAKEIMRKFEANYTRYLENIAKILTPQGICVFIFPQLHTKENQLLSLDIERLIKQKNFQICSFKVNNIQIPAYFVHSWKEPIIERQIVVFKKNND
jgi:tRNA G10  N-methylase Trm11